VTNLQLGRVILAAINDSPAQAVTPERLRELRGAMLRVHKILLEAERADFEKVSGRLTSGELLQLLVNHPQFAWLRRISAIVVEIDEALAAEEPATEDDLQGLAAQARLLFTSSADKEFSEKYQAALQRDPDVVLAHSAVINLLR